VLGAIDLEAPLEPQWLDIRAGPSGVFHDFNLQGEFGVVSDLFAVEDAFDLAELLLVSNVYSSGGNDSDWIYSLAEVEIEILLFSILQTQTEV
jgi:hypothetical protein